MEPRNPLEAHIAWKMKFAPYIAQTDGSFCAMEVTPEPAAEPDSAPSSSAEPEPIGRIVALPAVASPVQPNSQLCTRLTAVLILAHDAAEIRRKPPLSARPVTGDSSAAIRSLLRLKGRFSA